MLAPVAIALALVAACGGGERDAAPRAQPARPAAPDRNVAMGTGEPRIPEPFTVEQRLLDAVRRNDRATIERALERGATVHAKDDLQRSTVLLAVKDAQSLDLVRWLQARGAALDEPDLGGRTPLSFAAEQGLLDAVGHLLAHGAAADRADREGRTPLFHAALGDHADVVAVLADHGADVNVADRFGDTPLMVACAKGHARTAALLLARGTNPSAKDQEGRTAKSRSAPGTEPCLGLPSE